MFRRIFMTSRMTLSSAFKGALYLNGTKETGNYPNTILNLKFKKNIIASLEGKLIQFSGWRDIGGQTKNLYTL